MPGLVVSDDDDDDDDDSDDDDGDVAKVFTAQLKSSNLILFLFSNLQFYLNTVIILVRIMAGVM